MVVHSPVDIKITKFVFWFFNVIYFQFVDEHEVGTGLKAEPPVLINSHTLPMVEVCPEVI